VTGGSAVDTVRVTLRPLLHTDAADIEPWLAEAAAAVDGVRPAADTPATLVAFERLVSTRWPGATIEAMLVEKVEVAGLLAWRRSTTLGDHASAIVIEALAVRAGLRNLGYGAEAVYRLEAAHPQARVYAAIPRMNGLAIYFWLRAGYRPLRLDEDATLVHDPERLWMVNGLSPSASGASPAR